MKSHSIKSVNGNGLTLADIGEQVSSVTATKAADFVSKKYSFISTQEILASLAVTEYPLVPFSAQEQGTRKDEKVGYTKHVVRLRAIGQSMLSVGQVIPEVIVTNSHCRTASLTIEAGLYRCVCANQLTVATGSVGYFNQRHTGTTLEHILDAVYRIVEEFPQIDSITKTMQSIILAPAQQIELAEKALALRFPDANNTPIGASALLQVRRAADMGSDLFTVWNKIQENTLRGGLSYRRIVAGRPEAARWSNRRNHMQSGMTRPMTGLDAQADMNRKLWSLAMDCARIYA